MFWHHSLKTVQFYIYMRVYTIQYVHKFLIHNLLLVMIRFSSLLCLERKCIAL